MYAARVLRMLQVNAAMVTTRMTICSTLRRTPSWTVSDLACLPIAHLPQQVADAADHVDLDAGAGFDERAAQLRYMRIQRIRLDRVVETVDRLLQHLTLHRAAVAIRQRFEQEQLAALQAKRPTVHQRLARGEVETEVAQGGDRQRDLRRTAGNGADAREQLLDGERLDQVVVRAQVQPFDAVGERAA